MTELLSLQEQFQTFLLTEHPGIKESIVPTEWISVDTRLAIYRDGYKLRLTESLTTNFPGLHLYLGTEEFKRLCSAYIDGHPSSYRSIRWYGDALAHFIKIYYDKRYPYLTELAEFEWKMTVAFDAAEELRVRVEDMAAVVPESWAGLQFTIHPSVQRMNYFWNVIPLWQSLVKDQDISELENISVAKPWVIWRSSDYQIQFYSMSEEEAWALDAMIQGLSFGELCEGLCQWIEEEQVGTRAASFLKGWIQNGMLSRLLISD